MAKETALAVCPPLPAGSVDFDALAAACKAGKDAETVIAEATKNNPVPEEVAVEAAADPVIETPAAVEAAPVGKE